MRLSDLTITPADTHALELTEADARAILTSVGACYANANSGELVRACLMHVPFFTPLASGHAGDVLVSDEYGNVYALDASTFRVAFHETNLCPVV